jgi:iron(III) transport system substrate-binding protein
MILKKSNNERQMAKPKTGIFSCLIFFFCSLLIANAASAAPTAPSSNENIYMYRGSDRNQNLVSRAKKEGTLTFYTSLSSSESMPIVSLFEKRYGIKVVVWRTLSDQIAHRIIEEGRAHRYSVDVMETYGSEIEKVGKEKLLSEFYSPYFEDLPKDAFPSSHLWVANRVNYFVVAYNTNKIRRDELPENYEGFLDPKWKGKLAIEASDVEWMATIIETMGYEKGLKFFKDLAAMQPQMRVGHILMAQMVGAGDIPVALTIYNGEVESLKRKGVPIEWMPVNPVVGRTAGVGIAKNAPHPNAALLFVDFLLSPEIQQMYADMGRAPVSTKVQSTLNNFPHVMSDTQKLLDEDEKWTKLWNSLFKNK